MPQQSELSKILNYLFIKTLFEKNYIHEEIR